MKIFSVVWLSLSLPLWAQIDIGVFEQKFNDFALSELDRWEIPGFAVAVVKDGEVVFSRGYGYRDVENKLPADADTLYAIGSCSKAFTATAIGIAVDKGMLQWDDKIVDHLHDFRLMDQHATLHATPIDLLSHRTGLPRHDLLWYGVDRSRQELFSRLRYLEPSAEFRETYQYNNLMFMTAGYLLGQVSGSTWEDFTQKHLLDPLEMKGANFSVNDSQKTDNYALPYEMKDKKQQRVDFLNIDAIGPAGSINASVNDMAKWLIMNLNKGKYGDTQVVSENALKMIWGRIHTPTPVSDSTERYFTGYALGWGVGVYRGSYVAEHSGGIDGFRARVALNPHENLGVVVLSNSSGTPILDTIQRYAQDLYRDLEPTDWSGRLKKARDEAEAAEEEPQENANRTKDTKPTHKLADYTGDFEHPGYGLLQVTMKEGQLRFKYYSHSAIMEHWQYNTFRVTSGDLKDTELMFHLGSDGSIASVSTEMDRAIDPTIFKRKAPDAFSQTDYLEAFVGQYAFSETSSMAIVLRAGKLIAILEGQPEYTLEPKEKNLFQLKNMKGFTMKFEEQDGKISAVTSQQPNGNFKAVRQ